MTRACRLIAVGLAVLSCAMAEPRSHRLVGRAVEAVGGASTLSGVRTLVLQGTMRHWAPEQSVVAGGEMRYAGQSSFEAVADIATGASRIDWVRHLAYPVPRTFLFSELVTPEGGYVTGVDSDLRTRRSLAAKPPGHTMSGSRLAATLRELRRASPLLLLEMEQHLERVSAAADVTFAGVAHPAVDYRAGAQTFTIVFDPATGLPARIRTLDYDNIWGDVTYDLVLAGWQALDGLRVATRRTYELAGRRIAEVEITQVRVNPPDAGERLAVSGAIPAKAARPAIGSVPYQWIIRRQATGTYLDSDAPGYDAPGAGSPWLVALARGVQHVVGGTHHSLVVEMRDHLIVFDAPIDDGHSRRVLDAARAKFAGKPVKYLVLTHHHMDHAGGLRAYAAQGATIVVGKGNGAHFRRVLAAPFTRNPDLAVRDLSATPIIEVARKRVLTDGRRRVHLYRIDNPHAAGMLIGYVADARLAFVTDLWNPGAPMPAKLTRPLAALLTGVKAAGIWPRRLVGGHGSVTDYPPLAALEGR